VKKAWIPLGLLLLCTCATFPFDLRAQAIEDPGLFPVGWRDVSFDDVIFGQGTIDGRVFYPALVNGQNTQADPQNGPYPLVAFQHGWLMGPGGYDNLCTHIASWGFVIASTGTETGLFPNTNQFVRDTRAFLHWIEAEATDLESWLFAMTDGGAWSAVGHSMGGGTLSLLIGIESRIATIVGLQSVRVGSPGAQNMQAFPGNAFQIAGGSDWIVHSSTVHDWFENAISARRNIFYEIQGMGHTTCTDNPAFWDPLSGVEQARIHQRLVTGLLRAEVGAKENLYVDLLGEGIAMEPVKIECACLEPPFWARISAYQTGSIAAGMGGYPGFEAKMTHSLVPASIPTVFGELAFDPGSLTTFFSGVFPAGGILQELIPIEPAWSGRSLFLQGIALDVGGGTLTATVEIAVP